MESTASSSDHRRQWKRAAETALVALPLLLVVLGLSTGTITWTLSAVFPTAAIVALALWVWTQHWSAYVALLLAGIVCVFAAGLLAAVFWMIGGIYILLSAANLAARYLRSRQRRPLAGHAIS